MPKIFSNIAKTTTNLQKRYSDSTVNNNLGTFVALRNTADNTLGDYNLVEIRRVEDVYDLYQQTPPNLSPITKNYSQLLSSVVYTRKRATKFYRGFALVNPLLTATNIPSNGTFIEIYPDDTNPKGDFRYIVDRSQFLQESRISPFISGPRDTFRITQFLLSSRGLKFIANQSIGQKANTFAQSRNYSETSIPTTVGNYSLMNLNVGPNYAMRMQTGEIGLETFAGRLQRESVIKAQEKLKISYVGGAERPVPSFADQLLTNALDVYVKNKVLSQPIPVPGIAKNLTNWLNDRFNTNFSIGDNFTLGQVGNRLNQLSNFAQTLSINVNDAALTVNQTAYDQLYNSNLWPLMKQPYGGDGGSAIIRNFQNEKEAYIYKAKQALQQAKTEKQRLSQITTDVADINGANKTTEAYPDNDYRSSVDYTDSVLATAQKRNWAGITTATYLKDSFNLNGNQSITDARMLDQRSSANSDYIRFTIKVPSLFDKGISFRAFIEDLNHSTKGEYNSVRYVGRPERFITYSGMTRSVTLSMYLIAFSQDELDAVWTRANVLNKLMYPIDSTGGYMTPPLARITIGNVLVDQPGFMETVDMRFTDIPWDIDKELPQAIKLNMTYNIIEEGYITQSQTSLKAAQLFNKIQYGNRENRNGPTTSTSGGTTDAATSRATEISKPIEEQLGFSSRDEMMRSNLAQVRQTPSAALAEARQALNNIRSLGTRL